MKNLILITTLFLVNITFAQVNLNAESFKQKMTEKNTVVIDLRTPEEITKKGKIKGAFEINWFDKNSETIITKLDKTKNYLLYCAGGGRSGECLDLMQKNNFKSVAHLQNGFDEWVKKGFEVEKKK
ncbi:MAG: rhodanese-like domain-containing protein [Bacteroidetes bacterium]|nr:rhodanese-like domain-containing protein [Bacteroidota bacterium]